LDYSKKLKILFVEDLPTDMELAEYHLRSSGLIFDSMRVEDEPSLIQALSDFRPDLVISDYSMPVFDGM
jgi:CheY-like chemotaxis protein